MKASTPMQNFSLEDWFSVLRSIPPRNPQDAKRGEANFLSQARLMAETVSKTKEQRHIGWIDRINTRFFNKELSPMYLTIGSIVLLLSLMFGGTGATVLAAQGSLPNQPLYQVKTFSEDISLRYTQGDTQRIQMELQFANRRVNEMVDMKELGIEPPEAVLMRLETHLDQAVSLAARIDSRVRSRILQQIRDELQQQIRSLENSGAGDQLMARAMETVQLRLGWVELGLNEPEAFQEQSRFRNQFNQPPETGEGFGPNGDQGSTSYGPNPGSDYDSPGFGPGSPVESDPPGYSPGPGAGAEREPGYDSDPGQKPEEGGYQAGPNQDAGQNPDGGGEKPKPGCEQNCTDPNPDPGPKNDESNSTQNSENGSGKGNGNKP